MRFSFLMRRVRKNSALAQTAGVLFILVLFGCAVYIAALYAEPLPTLGTGSIAGQRTVMTQYVHRLGPTQAYARFKDVYKNKDYSVAHNTAHLFGSVLYDTNGLSAISACDASYGFGCYHGFIIEAIAARGIPAISALDAACRKSTQPSACEHGIGHGILEYLGHDHLAQALDTCELTKPTDQIAGCRSGVFMEYNVPIAFDDESASFVTQELEKRTSAYDPCPSLAEKYQPACYYSLAQWWRQAYGPDAAKMARLCAAAPAPYRTYCAVGIGNIAASMSETDSAKAISYCAAPPLPAGTRDICLRAAAGSFISTVNAKDKARIICEAVNDVDQRRACEAGL